jgi:hypothetical protein
MFAGIIRDAMTDLEDGAGCLFTGKDGRHLVSHVANRNDLTGNSRESTD